MISIGEKVPRSKAVNTLEEALTTIDELGLPLIIRPAYTLGGAGGGIAYTKEELLEITERGLKRSRITRYLLKKALSAGRIRNMRSYARTKTIHASLYAIWKTSILLGITHRESIVVTPSRLYLMRTTRNFRSTSIKIIRRRYRSGCQYPVRTSGDDEVRIVED